MEVVGGGHADAIGFARDGDDACGAILRIRDGRLIARDHRFLENVEHESDGAILSAFLVRFYLPARSSAPTGVLLPFVPDDLALAPGCWRVTLPGSCRSAERAPSSSSWRTRTRGTCSRA